MIIEQLLEFNRLFVANRQYEQFVTSKLERLSKIQTHIIARNTRN